MRLVVVRRERLVGDLISLTDDGLSAPAADVIEALNRHDVPDGFRFLIDDDGTFDACQSVNQYLLNAWAQRAYDLTSLRDFHAYHLARLLRFVRARRDDAGHDPRVDLVSTTRADLVAYRDARERDVAASTLSTELGCMASFFHYAVKVGWMEQDPIPRWGRRQRNTLVRPGRRDRVRRFLTAPQTRRFLETGLRGDGAPAGAAPAYPERDYVFGLLLASTGLRRREGALLLDCEVPPPTTLGPESLHVFDRLGKKHVIRSIYITAHVAQAADLYRQTERAAVVAARQQLLWRKHDAGELLVVDDIVQRAGETYLAQGRRRTPASRLSDPDRARAVRVLDDGTIEPLALLLARHGLPSGIQRWNYIFNDAAERVRTSGQPDQPPGHITVTPHTMRHSYAVRMLSALMRAGRQRAGDPYLLLANPVLTVKELMGHASLDTTMQYLHAAETWTDELPNALDATVADLVGHTRDAPGPIPDDDEDQDDDEVRFSETDPRVATPWSTT